MAARWLTISVLLALMPAGGACRSAASVTPDAGVFAGEWVGPVQDDQRGEGTARLTLTDGSQSLAGTYRADFAGGGTVTGTVSGTTLGARATAAISTAAAIACPGGLVLTGTLSATLVVSSDRLTGQYTGFTCGGALTGRFELVRE